jgi:hypothetical protein
MCFPDAEDNMRRRITEGRPGGKAIEMVPDNEQRTSMNVPARESSLLWLALNTLRRYLVDATYPFQICTISYHQH